MKSGVFLPVMLQFYLNEYLNEKDVPDLAFHLPVSPLPSPSKSSVASSQSFDFSIEDIRANSESLCEAIARDVGKDFVCFVIQTTFKRRTSKPSSKYAATMRRVASELICLHEEKLTAFIVKLQMDQINGYETLVMVANEIFAEGREQLGSYSCFICFRWLGCTKCCRKQQRKHGGIYGRLSWILCWQEIR